MNNDLSLFEDLADEDGPDAESRSPAPRRRRRRWPSRPLVISLASVLVLFLAAGAVLAWYLNRIDSALSEMPREQLLPARTAPAPEPTVIPRDPGLNYVLMGSDSRGSGDIGRSDTLIVAHVSADKSKIYLISFPRDMWVDIPGKGKGKINWAYAFGGPQLTVQTLDQLLGVRMDHAAVVDFEGFVRITEALDGVEVFNKRAFHSNHNGGHVFPAGMVTLKGDTALAYVRERYNLPNGDLDRAENQRDVVRAILDKGAQPAVLANPATVDAMLTTLSGSVRLDEGLTNEVIRSTALSMKVRSGRDIVNFQAPMTGFGWAGDQAIAVVDEAQMAELGAALREDRLDDYLARFPDSCTGPNC